MNVVPVAGTLEWAVSLAKVDSDGGYETVGSRVKCMHGISSFTYMHNCDNNMMMIVAIYFVITYIGNDNVKAVH